MGEGAHRRDMGEGAPDRIWEKGPPDGIWRKGAQMYYTCHEIKSVRINVAAIVFTNEMLLLVRNRNCSSLPGHNNSLYTIFVIQYHNLLYSGH